MTYFSAKALHAECHIHLIGGVKLCPVVNKVLNDHLITSIGSNNERGLSTLHMTYSVKIILLQQNEVYRNQNVAAL